MMLEAGRGAIAGIGGTSERLAISKRVNMHELLYKQLMGEPIGAAPAKAPTVGVTLNIGGSAVTNCVTVLRRER